MDALRRGRLDPNATRPIECFCAVSSPAQTLELARVGIGMIPFGLAWRHVDHYLSGGGADYPEDLKAVLRTDSGVRGKLARAIARGGRGCVSISQGEYTVREHTLAFGAIDRMDYQANPDGTVHVWFKDRYEWHPESPRVSNCVHRAAVELKGAGAADYWMIGDAVVPLSLFGPTPTAPTTPPAPPSGIPRAARPAAPPHPRRRRRRRRWGGSWPPRSRPSSAAATTPVRRPAATTTATSSSGTAPGWRPGGPGACAPDRRRGPGRSGDAAAVGAAS